MTDQTKLKHFNEIEKNLGIDLLKLITAEEGYCKVYGNDESINENIGIVVKLEVANIDFNNKTITFKGPLVYKGFVMGNKYHYYSYGFNQYGKAWSFIKKELSNE